MTLEEINFIAQTVAAFAVVGSLIYLAIQTRHATEQTRLNTQALKASAGFEATHSWGTFNETAMSLPNEKLALALAAHNPDKAWDDFSEVDQVWLSVAHRALFQKLEGQYFLFKYGSLDPAIWGKRRDWAAGFIQLPFFQQWWEFDKAQNLWTDEFIAAIEAARDASTVVPWHNLATAAPDEQQPAAEPLSETSAP